MGSMVQGLRSGTSDSAPIDRSEAGKDQACIVKNELSINFGRMQGECIHLGG